MGQEFTSLNPSVDPEINTWNTKWDKLIETYPMIAFVADANWYDDDEVIEAKYKSIADYIVLVNKSL
jgi:hypothetical protein